MCALEKGSDNIGPAVCYTTYIEETIHLSLCTKKADPISAEPFSKHTYCSRCSFSMMVKWANDGLLQANDGKMLVNDGEMLVNDGVMSVWYTHYTIIDEHFTIICLM